MQLRRLGVGAISILAGCAGPSATAPPAEPAAALPDASNHSEVEPAVAPGADAAPDPVASDPTASDGGTATAAPLASSASPDAAVEPPPMKPGKCQAERWGGWTGTAECRARANQLIPASHKPCTRDSECVMVGSVCTPHAVSKARAPAYEDKYACGNPRAGQCAPRWKAVCETGCCALARLQ